MSDITFRTVDGTELPAHQVRSGYAIAATAYTHDPEPKLEVTLVKMPDTPQIIDHFSTHPSASGSWS